MIINIKPIKLNSAISIIRRVNLIRYFNSQSGSSEELKSVQNWKSKFNREQIPYKTFETSFHRSSGAGGQNVNKVATKVNMRFDLNSASWIPNYVKNQLKLKFPNKVTKTGEYIISSERTRSQFNNLQDCVTKIYEDLLVAAYIPPPPSEETLEKIDKLKEIEKEKLKRQKQLRSNKKQNRGKQYRDD